MNISNALTVSRIFMVPVIALLLIHDSLIKSVIAASIFGVAVITDYLDGYFARKYHQESDLGKLLDPLADKFLMGTILIMLIPLQRIPAWIVAIIIARDALIPLIVHYPILGLQFQLAGDFFVWIALYFTLWSGVEYFINYYKANAKSSA